MSLNPSLSRLTVLPRHKKGWWVAIWERVALGLACAAGVGLGAWLLMALRAGRQSHNALIQLLQHLADWGLVLDQSGRILYVTESVRSYGWEPTALVGRAWSDVMAHVDHPFFLDLLGRLPAGERAISTAVCGELLLPRGDRRSFEATICPMSTDRRSRRILLFHDVTARRRIDASMAHLDRLAAVAHLSAGVSHNFNNILAGIMLNAELLVDAPGPERAMLAQRIHASAERGAALCSNLATLARNRQHGCGPVEVAPLLRDLIALFETEANRYAIAITWTAPPRLTVLADRVKVEQILLALLFNGREAVGNNGRIWIDATPDGDQISITVSNSGPAIPPERLPLIFLPFFSTKADQVQSTGMGLAVSQSFAQGMGGRIEVDSPPNGPTTFTLVLPAVDR